MAETGETFISPTMRSRMTFLVTTADSGGERIVVEFENEPDDIGPPCHYHPFQEEEYEILEGELTVRIDGQERTLRAGEKVVVPPGAQHTFWNATSSPVRFTSEHRPALGWERFITTIYDLDYDGRCNKQGIPRPLQMFTMLSERKGEEFLAAIPRSAQRLMAGIGGFVGRLLGVSPAYRSERRAAASPRAASRDEAA